MKLSMRAALLLVAFVALSTDQNGPVKQTTAIFPLEIAGGLAKSAIGRIKEIRQGIRQHIRQRMCEVLRQGRVYVEPCDQLQKKPEVTEEVVVEEYRQPNRGGGGGG